MTIVNLLGFLQPSYSQNIKVIDSLKLELGLSMGNNRFEILRQLSYEYIDLDNLVALEYGQQAYEYASDKGDSLNMVKAGRVIASALRRLENINQAIIISNRVLSIARRNNFDEEVKLLLNPLAVAYTFNADYDAALRLHFESLEIREAEGDGDAIGITLNNIGLVYYKLKNYKEAITFYERAQSFNLQDAERILINIGLCNNQLGQFKSARENILKALEECGADCDERILMEGKFGLGVSLFGLQDFNAAKDEFQEVYKIAIKIGEKRFQGESKILLARIAIEEEDYDLAKEDLEEVQIISLESGFYELLIEVYKYFSILFRLTENFEKASSFQTKYITLKDSIYSEELMSNFAKIQSNYEERVNIKTIQEQDESIRLQNELIARQRIQYLFIVLVTVLIVLLASVLIWANRRQHRHNAALTEAKRIIEEQNKELTKSNEELDRRVQQKTRDLFLTNESLSQVNEELDNFIYRTSHDIRGPLVTLKGVCNVAMLDVKDNLAIDYLKRLDLTAEKLNSILTRLLFVNQINHSDLEANPIDIKRIIDDILVKERKKGLPPRLSIDYQVDPAVKLISDPYLLKIVMENLIDNAIKFYNTSERINPYVKIKIERATADMVTIRVEDNGIGINSGDKDQIFHLFVRASERSETGGIGLYLSKLCAHRLGGEIVLSGTSEKGTTFIVLIPSDLRPLLEKRREEDELRKKDKALRDKEMQASREKEAQSEIEKGISSKQNKVFAS